MGLFKLVIALILLKLLLQFSFSETRHRRSVEAGEASAMKSEQDKADDIDDDEDVDPDSWTDDDRPLLHSETELPRKRSSRWYVLSQYRTLTL